MAIEDYLADIQGATGGARSEAEGATSYYTDLVGQSGSLPAKLKEALGKKLDYNKDLISQENTAMGEYFAAPAVARDKFQNVWNPFEREKLVQQDKSQAMSKWGTFSDLIGQRMGQVSDIVGEGISGWQSVVQQAQAAAQAAQQKYQSILNEYMQAAGMQSQADERAMQESQFNQTFGENQRQFNITNSKRSGGSGGVGSDVQYKPGSGEYTASDWAYAQQIIQDPSITLDVLTDAGKRKDAVSELVQKLKDEAKNNAASQSSTPASSGGTNIWNSIGSWFKPPTPLVSNPIPATNVLPTPVNPKDQAMSALNWWNNLVGNKPGQ